jgi:hypothetical protein
MGRGERGSALQLFFLPPLTCFLPILECSLAPSRFVRPDITASNTYCTIMSTYEEIDSELARLASLILELQQRQLALRQRRNSLTALYRLPTDILLRIISTLTHLESSPWFFEEFEPRFGSLTSSRFYNITNHRPPRFVGCAWAQVTHVCAHIRHVSLRSPSLWRDIEFNTHPWEMMCLERSRSVPISATIRHGGDFDQSQFDAASQRIRHLSIYNSDLVVDAILNSNLPLLERLHCSKGSRPFTLMKSFLGGHTSNLTSLTLTWGVLSESVPAFPALAHLHLSNLQVENSFDTLFKLLGQTPELIKLSLVDLSPTGISQRVSPAPGSTTVFLKNRSLPKLTTVFLCNSMEHTNMILQRLPDPIQMLHIASFALQHLETLLRWNKIMDRMCTSSGNAADEVCAHVLYDEKLARIYRQPACDIRLATITSTPKRRFQFTSTIAGLLYTLRSISYIELDPRTLQELGRTTQWDDVEALPALSHLTMQGAHDHCVVRSTSKSKEVLLALGGPSGWTASIVAWLVRRSQAGHRVQIVELHGRDKHSAAIQEFAELIVESGAVDKVVCKYHEVPRNVTAEIA